MDHASRSNGARSPDHATALLTETRDLQAKLYAAEKRHEAHLAKLLDDQRMSAANLLHYMTLRSSDVRSLQGRLAQAGLSSLGRSEAHVGATLSAVVSMLSRLVGDGRAPADLGPSFDQGSSLLRAHTDDLFGAPPPSRSVRIMVTMPTEAASDPTLVQRLLEKGMNVMRINCAHDDASVWSVMIARLREARNRTGLGCRVMMDLGGPKLRTGPMERGPRVSSFHPPRDLRGQPVGPARVWLTADPNAAGGAGADAVLPVPKAWLPRLSGGKAIHFRDLRGRERELRVESLGDNGAWATCFETAYVGPETRLTMSSAKRRWETTLKKLPATSLRITLSKGERLILTRSLEPGRPEARDEKGSVVEVARIGCTLPEAFACARTGQPIWFDDGKIGGVIRAVDASAMQVEITHTRKPRQALTSDKGINLPETDLALSALTPKDKQDLPFVVANADMVALSFVRSPDDVASLEHELTRLGAARSFGKVLKIETNSGFQNLPGILLASYGSRPVGVMLARGDLAIEAGYVRLAELQEEILWVCEAAHLPVIWATQVLETLTKKGIPSRAEITDAAMAERAECVMLNKGPYVVEAVGVLDDILRRMEGHQRKKSATLRSLGLSRAFT
jgi:pyruvate kinase